MSPRLAPMSLVCLLAGAGTSLVGRETLAAERSVPAIKVSEAVYALNVLAAINNLTFVAVGDRQVKLPPAAEARRQSRLTAP